MIDPMPPQESTMRSGHELPNNKLMNSTKQKNEWSDRLEEYQTKLSEGCPHAAYKMAIIHMHGMGCDIKQDKSIVKGLLEIATKHNVRGARPELGIWEMCEEGNTEAAISTWKKGDDDEEPVAALWYGFCMYHGVGMKADTDWGHMYLVFGVEETTKQANEGDPCSQAHIGAYYSMIKWPSLQEDLGAFWFEMAAKQGHQSAISKLSELKKQHINNHSPHQTKCEDKNCTFVLWYQGEALSRFQSRFKVYDYLAKHLTSITIPKLAKQRREFSDLGDLFELAGPISNRSLVHWIIFHLKWLKGQMGNHEMEIITETGTTKRECLACGRSLHAIGRDRKNGARHHSDWNSRSFHKKCMSGLSASTC